MAYPPRGQYRGAPARPPYTAPTNTQAEYWPEDSYDQGGQAYVKPYSGSQIPQYPPNPVHQYAGPAPAMDRPMGQQAYQYTAGGAPGGYHDPQQYEQQMYPGDSMSRQAQGGHVQDQYGYRAREGNNPHNQYPRREQRQPVAAQMPYQQQHTQRNGYDLPGSNRPAPHRSHSDSPDRPTRSQHPRSVDATHGGQLSYRSNHSTNGASQASERNGKACKYARIWTASPSKLSNEY